jgi:hypothetical protein
MNPAQSDAPSKRATNVVPAILAGVFIVVFYVLIFQGGFCERYERKMQRREMLRQQLQEQRR